MRDKRDKILDTIFTVLVCLFLVFTAVEVYENQPDDDLQNNVQDFETTAHEKMIETSPFIKDYLNR